MDQPSGATGGEYAEIVVNVEAPLTGTFHYHIPADLRRSLALGHLVEVEFGRRLAQGVVVGFGDESPVAETKPVISVIDPLPVLRPWQIALARWMSDYYLAPLNACVRLMLPPGLTRWADATYDINPYWDGAGQLTDVQRQLLDLLRQNGDRRGRQIKRALPKVDWQTAANQLVKRNILRRASVLDPPRAKPKTLRMVELSAGWDRVLARANELGRASLAADALHLLATSRDPVPAEAWVREQTGATAKHLQTLVDEGLVTRLPASTLVVATGASADDDELAGLLALLPATADSLPAAMVERLDQLEAGGFVRREPQPAALTLAVSPRGALAGLLRLRSGETYLDVLTLLAAEARPLAFSEVYAATNATLKHLRRLEELDLVRLFSSEIWRDSLADRDFTPVEAPTLTLDQSRVWGRIRIAMQELDPETADAVPALDDGAGAMTDSARPFLIHGVTGSGKTEIYMRAVDLVLSRGQQAMVLVPEIALTPQTVRRFAARFPGRVAIMHSGLSDGERYDTWRRARQGLYDIVVGPRSALFVPLSNPGVIILDEEHDESYKQTPPVPAPYYHARETAVQLGRILPATVILGSATPDVVTYHRAQSGQYQLLELPRRIMGHRRRITDQAERLQVASQYVQFAETGEIDALTDAVTIPLPPVQVVDLRQELRAGNRSIFSRALHQAIDETLARGEQAILLLNRRGTASFIICRDCGHIESCPRCDLPLTYHQPYRTLVCHQCGRREPIPEKCPECGSDRIRYFGLGTERVEEMVAKEWPDARIVRWDRDTVADHDSHDAILGAFIEREADILVGTQMIAKGLDLPYVTLVGVISADVALGLPDYRAGERAFQLLAQVAGRAGRGILGGRVIIQTYQPEHYAIQAAAEHDYDTFYLAEMRFRTPHHYPPYRRQAKLLIADPVAARAENAADSLARSLRGLARELGLGTTQILGPVPPFYGRIDGRYRWQIVIRGEDPRRLLDEASLPPNWWTDIDPVSLL
jgi:primosomal protein N' (replication factor Y)